MRRLRKILVVLGALGIAYVGIGLLVIYKMTSSSPKPPEATPQDAGLPYDRIEFSSEDGVRHAGWWVPRGGSRRAAVLVHGWGGAKSDEHVLATAPVYHDEGYNVLIIDLRVQGESGGSRRTLAFRETRDVRGALLWLEERGIPARDVVLHGWSMGGATVVRAATGVGVAAVVQEAGYADLPHLLEEAIPQIARLPRLFVPAVLLAGRLWPDFDPWSVRPEREAAQLWLEGVPFFIIHSTGDGIIPVEHAKRFAAAHPDATVWIVTGLEHVEAFAHPEYRERLRAFLRSIAPGPDSPTDGRAGPAAPGP